MLLQYAHVEKHFFSTFLVVCGITDFFSNDQMFNYTFTLLPN